MPKHDQSSFSHHALTKRKATSEVELPLWPYVEAIAAAGGA